MEWMAHLILANGHLRCQALRWYKTTLEERCIAKRCFHMPGTLLSSARQTRRNLTVDHLGRRYSVYRCILEWSYAEICKPTRLESLSVQKPSFHSTEMTHHVGWDVNIWRCFPPAVCFCPMWASDVTCAAPVFPPLNVGEIDTFGFLRFWIRFKILGHMCPCFWVLNLYPSLHQDCCVPPKTRIPNLHFLVVE